MLMFVMSLYFSAWRVGEYTIPAGSHLVPLLNKINMDPELFPEPDKFTPERFIAGDRLQLPDTFLPFGVGRRVCLGEQLARIELFLFFANMMNSFEFSLPEGQPMPELEGSVGTTHAPLPFNLFFRKVELVDRSSRGWLARNGNSKLFWQLNLYYSSSASLWTILSVRGLLYNIPIILFGNFCSISVSLCRHYHHLKKWA